MAIPRSESVAFRRWVFLGYWLFMFAGTHVPDVGKISPEALQHIPHLDKAAHFSLFAGWITLACWVVASGAAKLSSRVVMGLFAAGALYGAFDELTQSLVGRDTSLGDYLADLAGMLSALAIRWKWAQHGLRRKA
jgi:VanZ family protein